MSKGGSGNKNSKQSNSGKINFNLNNKLVDEEILSSSDDDSDDDRQKDDSDEEEEETTEQKRRRLANEYIRSMKGAQSDDDEEDDEDDEDRDANITVELRRNRLQAQGRYFRSCAHNAHRLDGAAVAAEGRSMGGHDLSVTCVALSSDERTIYSGSKDNSVVQWDAETGQKVVLRPKWSREQAAVQGGSRKKNQSHCSEVLSVAVTCDNKYLVSGGRDCKIRVFDTRIGEEIKVLSGHRDAVTSLCFQTGGSASAAAAATGSSSSSVYALFSGSLDRCVKHWDLSEMGYIETLFGHQDGVNCVVSGVDGNRPLTGGSDHSVRLWRVQEESHLVYRGQRSIVDTLCALTQESFVSGDENGSVCLWKVSQKRPMVEINMAHGACGTGDGGGGAASNSSSGRWISSLSAIHMSDVFASGSSDGFVRLWSVKDGAASKRDMLREAAAIPVPGFVNGLVLTPRLLVAGTGREHRLGRWWCVPGNKNKVVVMRLPELDAEIDDDDDSEEDEGSSSEEGSSAEEEGSDVDDDACSEEG